MVSSQDDSLIIPYQSHTFNIEKLNLGHLGENVPCDSSASYFAASRIEWILFELCSFEVNFLSLTQYSDETSKSVPFENYEGQG